MEFNHLDGMRSSINIDHLHRPLAVQLQVTQLCYKIVDNNGIITTYHNMSIAEETYIIVSHVLT